MMTHESVEPIVQLRSPEWIDGLRELCDTCLRPGSVVVEIGSFAGESTEVFARHAGHVYAIDPWHDDYASTGILQGCEDVRIRAFLKTHGVAAMSTIESVFDARCGAIPTLSN